MVTALWCLIGAIAIGGFLLTCMCFAAFNKNADSEY